MYHVLVVHAAGGEKLVVRGKGVVAVMEAIEGLREESGRRRRAGGTIVENIREKRRSRHPLV